MLKYYSGLPTWAKAIVWIAIILIVFTIVRWIKKEIDKSKGTKSFEDDYQKYCSQGGQSYPEATYLSLAGKIYEAGCPNLFCFGTDETAIYDVFKQMNTDCDVVLLNRSFGKRTERGVVCLDIPVISPEVDKCGIELGQWLQTEFSGIFGNIDKINQILADKGLQSRF